MRLFIAVVPPEPALGELHAVVEPLHMAYPGVPWSDPTDWHFTLAFLGEVPGERRADLSARLAGAASRSRRLSLRLAGSGHFDSRVLWAGVTGDLEGLHGLAEAARAAAHSVNVDHDPRPLRPHLTIAYTWRRERNDDGKVADSARPAHAPDIQPLVKALSGFRGSPWIADRLQLMSAQSAQAPRYAVVESWPLEGATPGGSPQR